MDLAGKEDYRRQPHKSRRSPFYDDAEKEMVFLFPFPSTRNGIGGESRDERKSIWGLDSYVLCLAYSKWECLYEVKVSSSSTKISK